MTEKEVEPEAVRKTRRNEHSVRKMVLDGAKKEKGGFSVCHPA